VLREIGVADRVAAAGVILVPVRRDLHDRRHGLGPRSRRKPQSGRKTAAVRERDPDVAELFDGLDRPGDPYCHG
jgi:hypothetical protein